MPDIHGCKSAKLAAVSKPVESHGSLPPIRKARPAVRPRGTRAAARILRRRGYERSAMGTGEPSPDADVGGASPVPVQMFR